MNQSIYSHGYNPTRAAQKIGLGILLLGGLAVAAFVAVFAFSTAVLGWTIEAFKIIL